MSRQHVAHAGDAAVCAADHREPLQCEGRPGAIPQQVFERLTIDTQLETKEPDPDACIDREPAVLPGNHVGGGGGEQASEPEPADHAAAHPLGERGQVCGGNQPDRQERRRGVAACLVSSRHEDAVGDACVQVHVVIERGAEAVQEGDATEPRAG